MKDWGTTGIILMAVMLSACAAAPGMKMTEPAEIPGGQVVRVTPITLGLINQMQAQGVKKTSAIMDAGRARLRPILMTTLTTALGLTPMAIGFGEGSEVRTPMAITVIGGLLVSTLLTLIVIPVVYSLLDRKKWSKADQTDGAMPQPAAS